eukprot:454546-Alexandrium_andersonii.AAC.1
MSASLVGSEMCIRDRLDPEPGRGRRGRPAAPRPPLRLSRRQRRVGPRPVSYTHLTLPTICSV